MTIQEEFLQRASEWSDIQDHLHRLHGEASRDGCVVLELGVRSGNSTAAFLAAVEPYNGHVYSVDITPPRVPFEWHALDFWTLILGDDCELAEVLPECDVLFIGTSHHYEHTQRELVAFWPKLRPGGVMLLHDTELEHPEGSSGPAFPVATALREWAATEGVEVEWVEGCYGLGVVKK